VSFADTNRPIMHLELMSFLWDLQQPIVDAQTLGQAAFVPRAPVYAYHALVDDIVPSAPAEVMARSWCASGATVEFVYDSSPDANHASEEFRGFDPVFTWFQGLFDGNISPSGCIFRTI